MQSVSIHRGADGVGEWGEEGQAPQDAGRAEGLRPLFSELLLHFCLPLLSSSGPRHRGQGGGGS